VIEEVWFFWEHKIIHSRKEHHTGFANFAGDSGVLRL